MSQEIVHQRPLFGGKLSAMFPNRFQDVSNIREVPDHQEVFADPSRDESLIVELLEYKPDIADNESATWFLQDLASEQDAEGTVVIEQSGVLEAPGLMYNNIPAVVTTAVGQMAISKGRQGREAQNIVKVYLANLRIKGVDTDVLITAYEPIVINPFSESADTVGAGMAVPAAQAGCMSMDEEELDELEKTENVSAICKELLQKMDSRPDPLIQEVHGPVNLLWDGWFEGPQDPQACRCWIL